MEKGIITADVIERLERLEGLVEKLIEGSLRFPVYPAIQQGCSHSRAIPSHMVINSQMTVVCPDCGEAITVNPTVMY